MRNGAVIVATGLSARMKQLKQMVKISDISIAERVIVNFRRAGVEDIVMVTGYNSDNFEKALKDFDVAFVRNPDYETAQMFDSARLGLGAIEGKCDRIFFCPMDVPFFTDKTVTEELELMDKDDRIDVIVPECGDRGGHPLLIRGSAIPDILAHNGERGMKGAYESLSEGRVVRISVDDEGAVTDSGTDDDYRKLVDIHNERIFHPIVKVIFASTSSFFGPGTVSLLKEIDRCGNVREACEKCGFSYSKGWTLLRSCEEKIGYTIVERQAGGQTGGAARVTDKGHDLVNAYDELERELEGIASVRFRELMKEYQLI